MDQHSLIKIVLLGDAAVGKSALLHAYTKGVPSLAEPYSPTHGVEFCSGYSEPFGRRVQFQIWDTAGDRRYRAPTERYCHNATGCAAVFDRSSRASFNACEQWLSQAREACPGQVALALVGTKGDLVGTGSVLSEVSSTEGRRLAKEQGAHYYETSATGDLNSVQQFFAHFIAIALRAKLDTQEIVEHPTVAMMGEAPRGAEGEVQSQEDMLEWVEQLVEHKSAVEMERDQLRCQLQETQARLEAMEPPASPPASPSPSPTQSEDYEPLDRRNPVESVPVNTSAGFDVLCEECGWGSPTPVSYTHLRAHETPEHLVCRLLLEKKKKK
eukprot:TRINITY_DN17810_c0_g1_i2.p1 TRINITY_DN17810_c0_g1~~TRINITY_DN17810_c0_g1_i2.p1  ORF type:complete len:327 (-),score=79.69 TRINITY_DN17810_c0_g1_i2:80-1060(-)